MIAFILRLSLLTLVLIITSSCGNDLAMSYANKNHHYEVMISSGWVLAKRWDFYNNTQEWNHELITQTGKGGVVKVKNGIFEFGYSTNGGSVYYNTRVRRIPKTSYLIIAKVKTDNPFRALIGFYTPSKLLGAVRIRESKWHIIRSLLSIDPILSDGMPLGINPSIKHLSREDYTYIDWIELWVYQQQLTEDDEDDL